MKSLFNNIPNQAGKVIIVTGANNGIGKVSALELARKGAHVIMACRSRSKTDPIVQDIKKATGNDKVDFMELDLDSLKSVKKFAQEYTARKLPIHVLLCNAGIMASKYETTSDGIEKNFGVNHVGHQYLISLLLPVIKASAPARIVCVSSLAHVNVEDKTFQLEDIQNPEKFKVWPSYGFSKAANIFYARQLARQLEAEGVRNVYVNSLHPGVVRTDLGRNMAPILQFFAKIYGMFFMISPEKGAFTQLYLSTHPDVETKLPNGEYYEPYGKLAKCSDFAKNDEMAKKVVEYTNKVIQEKMGSNAFDLN